MGRRILNRRDLRAEYEAAERREADTDTEHDEDDEEEEEEGEAEAEGDAEEGDEEEGEEEAPVKKKKKVVKEPKPKRVRAAKVVRMKVIWVVFNNSNQRVAAYDYPKKKEAEEHAAKLKADKGQTFFVQPVKEPIE